MDYLVGENEGCRQWLENAQSIKLNWYEANRVFGMLYNRLGQFDRAVESLEKSIQATPEYFKAHFQLALSYRRLGNEAKRMNMLRFMKSWWRWKRLAYYRIWPNKLEQSFAPKQPARNHPPRKRMDQFLRKS